MHRRRPVHFDSRRGSSCSYVVWTLSFSPQWLLSSIEVGLLPRCWGYLAPISVGFRFEGCTSEACGCFSFRILGLCNCPLFYCFHPRCLQADEIGLKRIRSCTSRSDKAFVRLAQFARRATLCSRFPFLHSPNCLAENCDPHEVSAHGCCRFRARGASRRRERRRMKQRA